MITANKYRNRRDALDALFDFDIEMQRTYAGYRHSNPGDFVVLNSEEATEYFATAGILLKEGANLLNGKPKRIQQLAGGLLRVHFSNEELTLAKVVEE